MVDWPHSPLHRLEYPGVYMVTAATYRKQPLLCGEKRLALVCDMLLLCCAQAGWHVQAWAVMPNHYHFVAQSPPSAESLAAVIRRLHGAAARALNQADGTRGRRVWFEYWDTRITFEKSYFARLKYVHLNPVKHGLVDDAEKYPWCSAAWFARQAPRAFYRTVMSFPTDRLNVVDVECDDASALWGKRG